MPARARADRSTRSVFVSSLSMVPSEAGNTSSDGDASIAAASGTALFIRSRLLRLNERDKPADDPKQESHLLTLGKKSC
jgi:hypothetical protein